jgi:hypothetical protein
MKILAGIAAVLALLWFYFFPTYHHRYKMTVEIEADGAVHTGVGVVDVRCQWQAPLGQMVGGERISCSLYGRAAVIDLGKRGVVLALVHPGELPETAYSPRPESGLRIALRAYYGDTYWVDHATQTDLLQTVLKSIAHETGPRIVNANAYPAFVWLPDPKNRETATPAPPNEMPRIIDSSVNVRSVTVEIAHQSLSDEIFSVLPWLEAARDFENKNMVLAGPQHWKLLAYDLLGES